MKLYNSITRKKEDFVPIVKGQIGMYVCGPTVYGPPHVGHARSYVNFDVIVRFFRFLGYKVKYVQGITDVGHLIGDSDDGQDKILAQALKEKIDPYEIAYKYEVVYFDCMDKLNVQRPSISSRATSAVPDMIEMIEQLVKTGFAYVTKKGNVYFRVRSFKNYGQLSNRKLDQGMSGERIEIASDKEKPEDFALWKAADPAHIMKWKSPWGIGFPGWHVECSAMSRKFLGKTFDIHGGGIDNIFPHHESEFAQSEAANNAKFVNYFIHNNLITVNGTKMGKSLGNFVTLPELFAEFDPMVVRFFVLQFHYRSPVDFNKDALKLAEKQFEKLQSAVQQLKNLSLKESVPKSPECKAIFENIVDALKEDFNTPVCISETLKFSKLATKAVCAKDLETIAELNFISTSLIENVLGFRFSTKESKSSKQIPSKVQKLAAKRWDEKKAKNFAEADNLRKQIFEMGFSINDSQDSYQIEPI